MSAPDDVARMLTLVPWLLERPGASLEEIADTFDVGVAAIRADLGHLDFCGLPGLGGGDLFEVATVDDRVVLTMADELKRPLRPTPREALRLVLTVDAVAEVLGDELPALHSAIAKVRSALGISEITADVLDPGGPSTLAAVRGAVRDRLRVTLQYQGRADSTPTHREVDPWQLHVVDGSWYLQGHDHGAGGRRVFRLDRVASLEVTGTPTSVPAPERLDPPRYLPGADDLEVELLATPYGRWIEDAVVVDEREELPDGHVRLRLRTDAPAWLARLVLMAAGEVRVSAPHAFAAQVREAAGAALLRYA